MFKWSEMSVFEKAGVVAAAVVAGVIGIVLAQWSLLAAGAVAVAVGAGRDCGGPPSRAGRSGSRSELGAVMRVGAVGVLCVGLLGCSDSVVRAPALFSASDNVERVRSPVVFDTAWVVGGPEDTLLSYPAFPRSDGAGGVVVFDLTNGQAYRIGADGSLLWAWGSKGEGPGEIMNVRAIDVRPDGQVVLVDSQNGRLVTLDAQGRLVSEEPFPLRATGRVASIAALADDEVAVHGSGRHWGVFGASGFVEAESPAGMGDLEMLHYQGWSARWRGGRWVFGWAWGNGWMVFDGPRLLKVRPYVQHTEFPEVLYMRQGFTRRWQHVSRPMPSGRSVSVRGDTLFVLFGRAGRALDRYDLRTGAYLSTEALPHHASRAAVGESGRAFTVDLAALFPTIVALDRRAPEVIESRRPSPAAERLPQ